MTDKYMTTKGQEKKSNFFMNRGINNIRFPVNQCPMSPVPPFPSPPVNLHFYQVQNAPWESPTISPPAFPSSICEAEGGELNPPGSHSQRELMGVSCPSQLRHLFS